MRINNLLSSEGIGPTNGPHPMVQQSTIISKGSMVENFFKYLELLIFDVLMDSSQCPDPVSYVEHPLISNINKVINN